MLIVFRWKIIPRCNISLLFFLHLILVLQLVDIIPRRCHCSTLYSGNLCILWRRKGIMKFYWQGKQHNAPTHLPSYCLFRLVELSWAQFDYMHCAGYRSLFIEDSNLDHCWHETSALTSRPTKQLIITVTFCPYNLITWLLPMCEKICSLFNIALWAHINSFICHI